MASFDKASLNKLKFELSVMLRKLEALGHQGRTLKHFIAYLETCEPIRRNPTIMGFLAFLDQLITDGKL